VIFTAGMVRRMVPVGLKSLIKFWTHEALLRHYARGTCIGYVLCMIQGNLPCRNYLAVVDVRYNPSAALTYTPKPLSLKKRGSITNIISLLFNPFQAPITQLRAAADGSHIDNAEYYG